MYRSSVKCTKKRASAYTSAYNTEAQFYSQNLSLTCKPTGTIALVSEELF